MKTLKLVTLFFASVMITAASFAQKTVEVGGAAMYPNKNIVENAVNSKDHTTLVAAVKAAGLVETLQSAGPFTVFAPTNAAFDMLPAGTVPTLLKEENKAMLTSVLTYHVVAGKYDAKALVALIAKDNGKATLKTVQGDNLYFTKKGNTIMVWDEKGGMASITIKDVYQSNGVIHVIDHVVMPK
ncbi:fasciclin domain-containing protein [soil metagenome]